MKLSPRELSPGCPGDRSYRYNGMHYGVSRR